MRWTDLADDGADLLALHDEAYRDGGRGARRPVPLGGAQVPLARGGQAGVGVGQVRDPGHGHTPREGEVLRLLHHGETFTTVLLHWCSLVSRLLSAGRHLRMLGVA